MNALEASTPTDAQVGTTRMSWTPKLEHESALTMGLPTGSNPKKSGL